MDDQDDPTLRKMELAIKLASLLYGVASLLVLAWAITPQHQRKLMAMQAAKKIEASAWRAAYREGHRAMGREASGRGTSYAVPYGLACLARRAAAAYDKMRYVP